MGAEILPGETIPAETGLAETAISFTKGCYPGQELVERMDSRGSTAPRHLTVLDRRPDVFLARRSNADGWLVKPLDPLRLRKAMQALLAGGTYHDATHLPPTIPVASPAP